MLTNKPLRTKNKQKTNCINKLDRIRGSLSTPRLIPTVEFQSVYIRKYWKSVEIKSSIHSIVEQKKKPTMAETVENVSTEHPQLKLSKFKAIQKNFKDLGISRNLATQSYPLNGKIFKVFLLFCSGTAFICVYISNYAETFFEYTQSIYVASIGLLTTFVLAILILKVKQLFEYINRSEDMLNMSKCWFFSIKDTWK